MTPKLMLQRLTEAMTETESYLDFEDNVCRRSVPPNPETVIRVATLVEQLIAEAKMGDES